MCSRSPQDNELTDVLSLHGIFRGTKMAPTLCGEMGSDDDDNDEAGTWQRMNWYFKTYGGSSLPVMATRIFHFGKTH